MEFVILSFSELTGVIAADFTSKKRNHPSFHILKYVLWKTSCVGSI